MRRGDWESALVACFTASEGKEHVYGSFDCVLFAADTEIAMTGEDPVPAIRGRYRSIASAGRLLKQLGFVSLEAAIDAQKTEVPVAFARRGDWVLFDGAVGVSAGRVALFVGAEQEGDAPEKPGFIRIPRQLWEKAWAVGWTPPSDPAEAGDE